MSFLCADAKEDLKQCAKQFKQYVKQFQTQFDNIWSDFKLQAWNYGKHYAIQFGDIWSNTFIDFVENFTIKTFIICLILIIAAILICRHYNYEAAIEIVDMFIFYTTPVTFSVKILVKFFIIWPCIYLYTFSLSDWKMVFIWVLIMLPVFSFFYYTHNFFFNMYFSLSLLQFKLLLFFLFFIIILFLYFLYKKYLFAIKIANFLFFIIKPVYLAVTNFFSFFFIKPVIFVYNLTLEDWKNIGVILIMAAFFATFLYAAYLFAGLCLKDLRWIEVLFNPVGYDKRQEALRKAREALYD